MKKCISLVIALLTVLFCFAACGKNKLVYTDASEYSEAISKSRVESSISESKQAEDIENAKAKTAEEVGKSVKGEKLVVKRDGANSYEYWVFNFDKSGNLKERLRYIYCDDDQTYESKLESLKGGDNKITDSDDNLRCIVLKSDGFVEMPYDTVYEQYKDSDVYEVIE